MQPNNEHSRINLADLKSQIVRKLGMEGSKQYFYYLQRFLSLKVDKVEFDKLCLRILGRDNIPLHNQFIRSVLRNACIAKSPPPAGRKDGVFEYLSNGGNVLPVSPRKARTGSRDKRSGDRRSALGPNGKMVVDRAKMAEAATTLPHGSAHVNSNDRNEKSLVRNGREEACARSLVRAPLGVPFCSASAGGARRAPPPSATDGRFFGTLVDDDALLDSFTLRERMDQIAMAHGLEGVSPDSANLLNHGMDSYVKGLIRSCIELVGAKSGQESTKNNARHRKNDLQLINGVKPGNQYPMQNSGGHLITLQDFRVAMELNPRKLGEDWPLLLDKICTQAFEE
ncbi:uncharacterized protein LOC127263162 [Andrographis paniculata]|uniref:uncharacterized protein LOC127263162 n=1 Tax=Andrographis paniculata TaxID=175694 RepID=UPI0021E8A731|nr:uncharacterized protein LOC127263162 [Andrographis paniculata]